jgi:two-component system response regulator AtoC
MTGTVENLPGMIGRHASMLEVYRNVRRYADTNLTMLVVGETGTGKELVARAVHELRELDGPFIDINCAAVTPSLFEGELFGWERGAFTSAFRARRGLLEVAHGGTLFLDELCSMPLDVQAKLLRAIEMGEFRRLGAHTLTRSRFGLVAAVSRPAPDLIADRLVREDLIYRVAETTVTLPPLRQRLSDVPPLAHHFLARTNGHKPAEIASAGLELLCAHTWPGNVRELRAVMLRACALSDASRIDEGDIGRAMGTALQLDSADTIRQALRRADGSVSAAARALGLPRTTLRDRISALQITLANE